MGGAAERRGDEDDQNLRFGISLARVTTPKRRHGNTIIRKALVRSKLGSERSCTNEDIVKCFDSWAFLGVDEFAMALTQLELVQSRRDDGNICLLDVSCGPGMFTGEIRSQFDFQNSGGGGLFENHV